MADFFLSFFHSLALYTTISHSRDHTTPIIPPFFTTYLRWISIESSPQYTRIVRLFVSPYFFCQLFGTSMFFSDFFHLPTSVLSARFLMIIGISFFFSFFTFFIIIRYVFPLLLFGLHRRICQY